MAWDFETDPEFQEKLDWVDDVRPRGGRAARPACCRTCSSRRSTTRGARSIDPLKEEVRAQGLWATHLGPELGGQGYGQLKLALLNEILGRSLVGADRLRLPGARHRQRRDHRPLRHRRAEGALPAAAARRRDLLLLLDDRAARRRRPDDVHDARGQGRRRVGHQRLEVLLLQRQDGVVPHRHGGDQPRRQRVPGHVDVPRADRHARASTSCATSASCGEPLDEGSHALIHYENVRVPADALLGGEGQAFAIAQTRLGGGRIHHAMRTIGMAQKAFDMMCERALSRDDAGQPAGRQAVRAGLHRRLLRAADAVPAVRALHRVGDRQVQRLQARSARTSPRPRWSCRRCCTTSPGGRCRCTARSASATRCRSSGMVDGAGVMGLADGPTEVHKVTVARQVLRDYKPSRRHLADRVDLPEDAGRGARRSTPSASSSRWGTCDRSRTPRRRGWTARACPARASRSSTGSSPAARRTRSTRSAAASCTARCASRRRPRRRAATTASCREWRIIEALDGTDVPHTAAIAVCTDTAVLGRAFYLMGFVDGWSPMGLDRQGGRRRSTPISRRARAWPTSSSRASRCSAKVDWQAKGLHDLGRPDGFHERQVDRWTAFLERIKGRELPGFDEAAAWLRAHRPLDFIPGLMHGDYQFANVMYRDGAPAQLAAIVDWEMGTVGDPKLDLGWVVQSWPEDTTSPEAADVGLRRHVGMPTRDEVLAHYAEVSGRQVDDIDYYVRARQVEARRRARAGLPARRRRREAAARSARSCSTSCSGAADLAETTDYGREPKRRRRRRARRRAARRGARRCGSTGRTPATRSRPALIEPARCGDRRRPRPIPTSGRSS